jgi:hypothetical protein
VSSLCGLIVKDNVALTSPILVTLMMESLGFYIQEDGILDSHCRENFKSYIALIGWSL